MRRPIGMKFCMVITPRPNFIMSVQNFGGLLQKNFSGQKRAKFGSISVDFKVQWRISTEWTKIFKIGQVCDLLLFLLCSAKKVR